MKRLILFFSGCMALTTFAGEVPVRRPLDLPSGGGVGTQDDEEEAQRAIQEGIAKAEAEEKVVTDKIAQPYK